MTTANFHRLVSTDTDYRISSEEHALLLLAEKEYSNDPELQEQYRNRSMMKYGEKSDVLALDLYYASIYLKHFGYNMPDSMSVTTIDD